MKAIKLQLANKTLLKHSAEQWKRAPQGDVTLQSTDPEAQPSPYVRAVWSGKRVGAVRTISVQAAYNRQNLFFRLEWPDPTHNADYGDGLAFPDAAAVLFPGDGDPPLARMGSPAAGIDAWYWRANREAGESLAFHGFATEKPQPDQFVVTSADWEDGRWRVVIGGPLEAAADRKRVAFAVWEGSNQERAGLHSYSPQWQELSIA